MAHPYDLLRAELARDGSRPFVTFYDDATGERVELSVATFDNWVAKTAGLLRDGLSAQPGDRVALLLPPHWQTLVWACAGWAVGTTVLLDPDAAASADVAVAGPESMAGAMSAPEVIALSLRPLGGRFTAPLPAGVLDYAVEVPAYPDLLVPYTAPPDDARALESAGSPSSYGGLVEAAENRAAEMGAGPGSRLLVPASDLAGALRDALLVPLAIGGSAVLVRHEDPSKRDARMAAERAGVLVA
jgi:uncharacterized protein (TIGR03089 family)